MKYIRKDIQNEPNALKEYRKTPNAHYKGYTDKDIETEEVNPLKKALLEEQGYLCAYCMGRISLDLNEQHKPKIEVEHFEPQETVSEKSLSYINLLGVCNGLSVTYPDREQIHHCDKTKGNEGKMNGSVFLKKLDPRSSNCEKLLKYNLEGKILAVGQEEDVKKDIEVVLNLNNKALIDARKATIDNAKAKMIREKPTQQWNKSFLQKHKEEWQTAKDGKYRPFCMVAVWFIQTLLEKPHYNR